MKKNTNDTVVSLNSLASGLKKNQPKGSFLLDGTKFTTQQLVTIMQSIVTALLAVPAAKASYLNSARSTDALQGQYRGVLRDLKLALQMQAKDDGETLADYGLTPRKSPGGGSPEVLVAAADKARATRAARHTMGSKQKLQITGATASAAAAASSAPASTTTSVAPPSATPVVTPGH